MQPPTWGDRIYVHVLMFALGFATSMQFGTDDARNADDKVRYAMEAVEHAHKQIDTLKGCTLETSASAVEVSHAQ